MDRFLVKTAILFLLLASLPGATFMSPKQDVRSGPEKVVGALDPKPGPATIGRRGHDASELRQYTAGGHVLGFREDGVVIASGSHALSVEFVNARRVSPVEERALSGPAKGLEHAPELGKVTYRDLWDGVTVVYEETDSAVLKSTYYIQPGEADVSNPVGEIRLRYSVPVRVDGSGDLVLSFATGEMRETRPITWQDVSGKRVAVESSFQLFGRHEVGFKVGAYDDQYPLVIDPVLIWNTFVGGSNFDWGKGIAVDTNGNSYVTGPSIGTWGSPIRPFVAGGGNWNAFVAKLNANGVLQWNTFLGGLNDDGNGIAVDTNGNVYVTGYSFSTWGSPVRPFSGSIVVFVAKLDTNGTLLWNTFLGGSSGDLGGIAVDTNGKIYVTDSSWGTWGSPVRPYNGGYDAFVARLDTSGALEWNTFLGGISDDYGSGIAVDTSGNCFVSGVSTEASWGSPIRPYAGGYDAFVAQLNTNGVLQWNSFLGGSYDDYGRGMGVDLSGNCYVTGYSAASWGSPARPFVGGAYDGFVAKLSTNGALYWNTFFGGIGEDYGFGIAVDTGGDSFVTGYSSGFWGWPSRTFAGTWDAFVAKLGTDGTLHRNTFLGGPEPDYGYGIAVGKNGHICVTGYSSSTWGSPVRPYAGGGVAFVAKVGEPKVDFNKDGREDIFWRYYGPGGNNRAWFLGNSEQAGLPLVGVSPRMAVGPVVQSSGNRVRVKTIGNERDMDIITDRPKKTPLKGTQDVMGIMSRQAVRSVSIDDPRKTGGKMTEPPRITIADPRQVGLVPETSLNAHAELASTPIYLGGADIMPVGDLNWKIVGTGDFNRNGTSDILWRYNGPGGYNIIWDMDGANWNWSPELLPVSDLNWQIVGTGDFNRDGYVDILWRYNGPGGYNVIWYMKGTSWNGNAALISVSDLNWQIVGTGDFNMDGNVDILWRYSGAGGYNVVWYLNNATWTGSAELISVGDLAWQIAGTGDYNNDGSIDLLWRFNGAGGYNVIWYMNGVNWVASAELLPVPNLNWKIVSR